MSNKLIQRNDSIAEVYYNAGLAYFNMAVELDKNTHLSRKSHQEITGYYQKALPYLEKFRKMEPGAQENGLCPCIQFTSI